MKRRNFLKTSLAMGATLATPDFLNQLSGQPALPNIMPPVAPRNSRHPLFFPPERIVALRLKIASDATMQARWKKLLQSADNLAAGKHKLTGEPGQTGMTLGLAWQITGEARYANKLSELLLESVKVNLKPGADADGHLPPWHSWLATAGLVVDCAVSREALEGFLSTADRQHVTEGMLRLGILPILEDWVLPENRIHALDSMGHNWWSVCVSGAGVGVLALLDEDPRAVEWLNQVETALAGFFNYQGMVLLNKTTNFDPTGAFYESVHYAGYALESYLTFRLAQTNAAVRPPQSIPVLEHMAEFFVHTFYPAAAGDLAVNFGDSTLKPDAERTMRLLAALGFSSELAGWYLQRLDNNSADPLSLLYLADPGVARNSLPVSVIYPTIGWAMLRNSWDDDHTLLGIKSGFTWNHAHADAGSFVLFHAGQPLLIDSGKCSYGRDEYLDYYCQSHAHNVVLFDDQGQPAEDFHSRGVKFSGHVHDLLDDLGLKYVYADATGPMARYFQRNYRHWLWIGGVILIFDDILAHEAGHFDWLLHYAGEARRSGARVELTNGPAQASVTMLYPLHPSVHEAVGLVADLPDKTNKYLKFSTDAKARDQKFMVAIMLQPPDNTSPLPEVELLQEPDALGVLVRDAEYITEVYLNLQSDGRRMHVNSNNTINGWETDAYLLALTRPAGAVAADINNVTRFFLVGCSYLRRDGQSIFDSFSKTTAVFQPGEHPQISFKGQRHADISFVGFQKPASLRVNGQLLDFTYDPVRRMIRFNSDAIGTGPI